MFSSPSAIGKTRCADNLINHSSKFFATCNEIKDGKRLHEKTNKLLYKYLATENSLILRKNNLAKILAEKQGFPTLSKLQYAYLQNIPERYSEPCKTSKMEF